MIIFFLRAVFTPLLLAGDVHLSEVACYKAKILEEVYNTKAITSLYVDCFLSKKKHKKTLVYSIKYIISLTFVCTFESILEFLSDGHIRVNFHYIFQKILSLNCEIGKAIKQIINSLQYKRQNHWILFLEEDVFKSIIDSRSIPFYYWSLKPKSSS